MTTGLEPVLELWGAGWCKARAIWLRWRLRHTNPLTSAYPVLSIKLREFERRAAPLRAGDN